MIETIEHLDNHIDYIRLKNDYLEVVVTNYGCTILKVLVKDKNGDIQDVVLGYDTIEEYQNYDAYLGALVGRVANRIGKGTFTLNNEIYHLAINNGPNSLHGGIKGFSYRIFDYEIKENELVFHYVSPDGEENYPGTLDFYAIYQLDNDRLVIRYQATTSKDTLINITNHSYFNLSGHPTNIDQHYLCIHSDLYAPVDSDGLTTGERRVSKGTPFDFHEEKQLKELIYQEDEQLSLAKGYDHPFIFN
ncbi:MAG: aldose epimerase family protein, partial [Faecalibacillus sp.]